MNKCTNPKLGTMLHAYELKALNESDSEKFELHLLECDFCFNELSSFNDQAAFLLNDRHVRQMVELQSRQQEQSADRRKSFWSYLWPVDSPLVLKPAFAYALTVLIVILFPLTINNGVKNGIGEIQSIGFMNTRSNDTSVFYKDKSSHGIINFLVSNAENYRNIKVAIINAKGQIIYFDDDYAGIDNMGIGKLYLPLKELEINQYTLELTLEGAEKESDVITYNFLVK